MMVFSILGSIKSVLWVILILTLMLYMFGIVFTLATLGHLKTTEMMNDTKNAELRYYFGTLDMSVLSLFMAMSGGIDWKTYYDSLQNVSFEYRLLFVLYITFATFAVVNVITGIFVEN